METGKREQLKIEYQLIEWDKFDYEILNSIETKKKRNKSKTVICNDVIIFLDTETSKSDYLEDNYIILWTLSIRYKGNNIVTFYGRKPTECISCLEKLQNNFTGHQTFIYVHNLPYDYFFLRLFLLESFGNPVYQLNVKPHYPIYIEFDNGITFRDSLILSQRSLEKWANDMDVEHKKAVGNWDYEAIRLQNSPLTALELGYAEFDTLAGVECVDALKNALNKQIYSMPWTATGIVRGKIQQFGYRNSGHNYYLKNQLSLDQLIRFNAFYHGGYCHGNRAFYNYTIKEIDIGFPVICYDFCSSYPYCMISEKFPSEKFSKMPNCSIYDILEDSDNAYLFKFIAINVRLKDDFFPMPALQYSKVIKCINPIVDNGRLLECDYIEILMNEIDIRVIEEQYTFDKHICVDVEASFKAYLPRWFTDYVFSLYEDKCKLKGGDTVLYNLSKSMLNSCYGLSVFYPIKNEIREDYKTGFYYTEQINMKEKYNEYSAKKSTVLPYQIGCWVTSYAFYNLFQLGKCVNYEDGGEWLYSDTDSCYAYNWDLEKIESYNEKCKEKLINNNYGAVIHNGKEYWLGIAELDGVYSEFKLIGAKRYCVRDKETGKLKITVAGVPKKAGGECLDNDIENFKAGFIFSGEKTGKKLHKYIYRDEIIIDDYGNEIGCSIDLSPCDYLLSDVKQWERIDTIESIEWFENEE